MTGKRDNKITVRFAPSPTGPLHVGSVRTALFNYAFARQQGGKLILRIEDTDKERSKKEYEDDIRESFAWLGLEFDESARQSARSALYRQHLEALIAEDKAYISKETVTEEGQRAEVIRFRNPNKKITFTDLIKGEITFDTTELKDFVIAKSLDEPVFHFAVVLDDFLMGVTHVIRGEDHISNTPRQILIQEALGAPRPAYAHLPLILAPDRSKLSKRKHGAMVSVDFYRNAGYLPEALLNFMALIGWNPGTAAELMSLDEIVKMFKLEQVQKSGAIFDVEKLKWMNKEYLKRAIAAGKVTPENALPDKLRRGKSPEQAKLLFETLFERMHRLAELDEQVAAGELGYFIEAPRYDREQLFWKKESDAEKTKLRLEKTRALLEAIPENAFSHDAVKNALWDFATAEGRGEVLWPLRFSLSGKDKSPDPFTLAAIFGKQETIARIDEALKKLSA